MDEKKILTKVGKRYSKLINEIKRLRAENDHLRAEMCAAAAAIGSAIFEYDTSSLDASIDVDKFAAARRILLRALNGGDDADTE